MNFQPAHNFAFRVTSQKEADELREGMLKLGYEWDQTEPKDDWDKYPYLSTIEMDCQSNLLYFCNPYILTQHIVLETYNLDFALAIAACTKGEDYIPGEWAMCITSLVPSFTVGKLYQSRGEDKFLRCIDIVVDNKGSHSNGYAKHCFRKPTLDELKAHFEGKEEPVYKTGDWVTVKYGKYAGLTQQLDEYQTYEDGEMYWFIKGGGNSSNFRPATPEEIAKAKGVPEHTADLTLQNEQAKPERKVIGYRLKKDALTIEAGATFLEVDGEWHFNDGENDWDLTPNEVKQLTPEWLEPVYEEQTETIRLDGLTVTIYKGNRCVTVRHTQPVIAMHLSFKSIKELASKIGR